MVFAFPLKLAATTSMEFAPPAVLLSPTSPPHSHASSTDVSTTSSEDARSAMKNTRFSIIAANCPTASFPVRVAAWSATQITSSLPVEFASQRISSVTKWMNSEHVSSASAATSTANASRSVSKKPQDAFTTMERAVRAFRPSHSATVDAPSWDAKLWQSLAVLPAPILSNSLPKPPAKSHNAMPTKTAPVWAANKDMHSAEAESVWPKTPTVSTTTSNKLNARPASRDIASIKIGAANTQMNTAGNLTHQASA